METFTPYTYLIGWTKYNKWYYGARWAKKNGVLYESGCHPDDLWVTYFTSSEKVLLFREKYGDPDIIEVRKSFPENPDAARKWENKVLTRINVDQKSEWLNVCNNSSLPVFYGDDHPLRKKGGHSEKSKRKMSESHKNKIVSDKTRKKMSESKVGEKNNMFGKRGSDSPNFGKKRSEETKEKIRSSAKNKPPISENQKQKISEANKKYKWWTNGTINVRSINNPNEKEYRRGRTLDVSGEKNPMYKNDANKGMTWWNKDGVQKRSKVSPGNGWEKGRIDIKGDNNPMRKTFFENRSTDYAKGALSGTWADVWAQE